MTISTDNSQRIESQVASGRFSDSDAVVRTALDLLEGRLKEYDRLSTAIEQVERGETEPLDMAAIKSQARQRMSNQRGTL